MYLLGLKKNYSNLKITGYIKAIFFCVNLLPIRELTYYKVYLGGFGIT